MARPFGMTAIVLLVLVAVARAEKTDVPILKTWKGSVLDEKLPQPPVIVSEAGLKAVWKAWKIKEEAPQIDFAEQLVVAVYSPGSVLKIAGAKLDERGNLEVLGLGTRDFGPGFRYVLGTVSRAGVKTVNGKELPKE